MKNIIILGDSIMNFTTYDEEQHLHRPSKNHDLRSLSSLGYKINNLSREGATVDTAIPLLKGVRRSVRNSYVIMGYGACDSEYDLCDLEAFKNMTYYPKNPLPFFEEEYKKAIEYARHLGAEVIICPPSATLTRRYLQNILIRLGLRSINGRPELLNELLCNQQKYKERSIILAAEMGLDVIDPFAAITSLGDDRLICSDGQHPTDKGYSIIEYELYRHFLDKKMNKKIVISPRRAAKSASCYTVR